MTIHIDKKSLAIALLSFTAALLVAANTSSSVISPGPASKPVPATARGGLGGLLAQRANQAWGIRKIYRLVNKVADVGEHAFAQFYPQQPCPQRGAQLAFKLLQDGSS